MPDPAVVRALRRAERAAAVIVVRALTRELGYLGTARVLGRVAAARLRGEPWRTLGPPRDERDRLSRRQCGDLVLLDRAVVGVSGDREAALRIARDAVLAGGDVFLGEMIPALPQSGLGAFAERVASRFFNAEGEARADPDGASFELTVTRCRFVELLGAVGAGHLAPLFCEADSVHFGNPANPVVLRRTTTLATGGPRCDFHFHRRNGEPPR